MLILDKDSCVESEQYTAEQDDRIKMKYKKQDDDDKETETDDDDDEEDNTDGQFDDKDYEGVVFVQ